MGASHGTGIMAYWTNQGRRKQSISGETERVRAKLLKPRPHTTPKLHVECARLSARFVKERLQA